MTEKNRLEGKKVLIVDDEPDVLDTLEDLLSMCEVTGSTNFDEAKKLLETQDFDLAVLDIMGVKGYELLDVANERGVPGVMLTAHALTPDNIVKSYKRGAAYFIPKEEMGRITTFLDDVLKAKEKGRSSWIDWLARLSESYWEKKFGPDWQNKDKEFWEEFLKKHYY